MMEIRNLSDSHYSLKVSSDVRDICKPLFSYLDLSYFYSTRVYPDGSDFVLSANPDILEYVYTHGFSRPGSDEYGHNILPEGLFFLRKDINYSPVFTKQYEELKNRFKLHHVLMATRCHEGYSDIYMIGSSYKKSQVVSKYLNNVDMINKFLNYFHSKASKLYAVAKDERNRLVFSTTGKSNLNLENLFNCDKRKVLINQMAFETNVVVQEGKESYLTSREKDCLIQLSEGRSIKETAAVLNLSPRTVSVHFKNIKERLNCYTKSEIIKMFRSQCLMNDEV